MNKTKSILKNRILPVALSMAMVLTTGFTAYAEESVTDASETQTEGTAEENTDLDAVSTESGKMTEETSAVENEEEAVAEGQETESEVQPEENTEEAEKQETEAPVTYTVHVDEAVVNGQLMLASTEKLQKEDLEKIEEGTVVYVAVQPEEDYELNVLKILDAENTEVQTVEVTEGQEGYSYLDELDKETDSLYSFTMPASDVTVKAEFKEKEKEEEEELSAESLTEEEKAEAMLATDGEQKTEEVKFAMIGFQSYEAAGYGYGYDAAFAPAAGYYEGNGNAYCLNPAVQAPGRDQMNTTVTYTVTTTAYTDPILLKILYYGFGGEGDLSTQLASDAPSRHILTHMALVKRAAELGIPGAGDYTYRANSTAIALADQLYALCASQPAVTGSAKVLTPVSGQQTIVILAEVSKKGSLTLTKTSADASLTKGNDCYSLGGAGYVVYSDSALTKAAGTFTTNADGKASVTMTLEPGTYYVKEVTAPKGYALDETVYTTTVTKGNTTTVEVTDQPLNDPITVLLEKVDAETGKATERLAGAEFTVNYYVGETSGTPDRTWVLKTDKNGNVYLRDSYKVSGDDFYYGASSGAPVLPLGTITIQETKAPEGYQINDTVYTCVTTEKNGTVVTSNLPTGDNAVKEQPYTPELKTKAVSKTTGTKTAVSAKKEVVVDTISYTNLFAGETYSLESKLVSVDTEEVIATATSEFTPSEASGTTDVELTADTTAYEGKILVVYETISYNGTVVAEHADKNDTDQQVSVPSLKTTAADGQTGNHTGVTGKTTIVDAVKYTNLIVGKEYTVKGTLHDKETGDALTIEGATAETTFTAEKSNGTVDLVYTIDASALVGKSVVVFEDILYKGKQVVSHASLKDENQTVNYPSIKTTAKDGTTGTQTGLPVETTIVDTVSFTNLTVGESYTVKGTLMNQSTGKALDIEGATAEATFTAEAASGTVDVTFTFDASSLKGASTTVFEKLFYNGVEVAEHEDITDEGQTVKYTNPKIQTTAKDGQTGTKVGVSGNTTVVDTVAYTNLIAGKEYTVKGTLYNKETGKALTIEGATAQTTFTAEKAAGTVDIVYTIDASALAGKSIVVFEDLYQKGIKIATHSDIHDEDQTVSYPEIKTTAKDGNTDSQTGLPVTTTIVDTVAYTNLTVGKEYTVKGTLINQSKGEALTIEGATAETTFTAESASGTVDVVFTFDASSLKGTTTVVFEKLFYNGVEVAVHEDITDKGQTVEYTNPEIKTTAVSKSTGMKAAVSAQDEVIVDTVSYTGLVAGETYSLDAKLVDVDTEEVIATGTGEFTPSEASGTTDVELTADTTAYEGKVLVVYEKLSYNGTVIAEHTEKDDADQQVNVPEIKTTATDGQTGDHTGTVGKTTIVDAVKYTNLIVGKEYTVKGTLHDKETGEALTIEGATAETTFTAEKADGTVDLVYTIDSSALAGKSVVVFEDLYTNGKNVVSHADIKDENQTVNYPSVKTSASADGAKEVTVSAQTKIIDTVSYTNLTVGDTYTVTGVLMDKATGKELLSGGKTVTGTATFTAESANGTVNVEFVFDSSSLGGTTTVVFEKLFHNDIEVATHADINDVDQTVVLKVKPSTPNTPNTGDTTNSAPYAAVLALAVLFHGVLLYGRRKRSR